MLSPLILLSPSFRILQICEKVFAQKRKPVNMAAKRLEGELGSMAAGSEEVLGCKERRKWSGKGAATRGMHDTNTPVFPSHDGQLVLPNPSTKAPNSGLTLICPAHHWCRLLTHPTTTQPPPNITQPPPRL